MFIKVFPYHGIGYLVIAVGIHCFPNPIWIAIESALLIYFVSRLTVIPFFMNRSTFYNRLGARYLEPFLFNTAFGPSFHILHLFRLRYSIQRLYGLSSPDLYYFFQQIKPLQSTFRRLKPHQRALPCSMFLQSSLSPTQFCISWSALTPTSSMFIIFSIATEILSATSYY